MGQRLGIAAALLGDPGTLLLDEPVNGLDPEGIQWIRKLLRSLADEGRSILVSSHLMSEMAQTADRLVVIGRGRLITQGTVEEVVQGSVTGHVRVDADQPSRLVALLAEHGGHAISQPDGTLAITGMKARDVGIAAGAAGITLYQLTPQSASLEDAFFELTRDATEYTTRGAVA
jgi:ABC-2 type transport system ATP-binding protein